MKQFIELTDENGRVISVNTNQITSFSQSGKGTHIYLTGTIQRDIHAQEEYEVVKGLVSSPTLDDKQ